MTQSFQYDSASPGPLFFTGSNSGSVEVKYPSNIYSKESDKWDLTMDVTVLQGLITASAVDKFSGIMLMHRPVIEKSELSVSAGPKKFFSNDTNTVYQPRLELKYDDYSWSTGKKVIGSDQSTVYYRGNSGKYDNRSTVRFRPVVRESFPTASYSTSTQADTIKTFSAARSMYAIVDVITDEEIIGYDMTFTRVSADNDGMYFDVPLEGFSKGRLYRPVIKVLDRVAEGAVEFFDSKTHFEVV